MESRKYLKRRREEKETEEINTPKRLITEEGDTLRSNPTERRKYLRSRREMEKKTLRSEKGETLSSDVEHGVRRKHDHAKMRITDDVKVGVYSTVANNVGETFTGVPSGGKHQNDVGERRSRRRYRRLNRNGISLEPYVKRILSPEEVEEINSLCALFREMDLNEPLERENTEWDSVLIDCCDLV